MSESSLGNQFNKNIQDLIRIVDEYEKQLKNILLENEELKDKIRKLEEATILKEDIVEIVEESHLEVMNEDLWLYLIQCWQDRNFQLISNYLHDANNQDKNRNHNILTFMQFNDLVWKSPTKHDEEETPIYLNLLILYQKIVQTSWNLETTGFIESEFSTIQDKVISTNMPKVIVELLKCLLYYDFDHELGELLQAIIEVEWSFLDDNTGEKEYITFLWYAFYVGLDNKLIKVSKTCHSYLENSTAEFLLYKMYSEVLTGRSSSSEIVELKEIRKKIKHFDEIEEVKIFFTLDKLCRENAIQSIPVIDMIFQIKPKTENCPSCSNQKLILKQAKIHTYLNPKFKKQVGFIDGKLLYCSKCSCFFGRHDILQDFKQHATPNHIQSVLHPKEYPPKEKKELKVSGNTVQNVNLDSNSFKWLSTHAEESSGIIHTDSNFQDQTALNRIGYKITGLSRSQRWDILSRKAILTMTLKDIVYTIAMLVKVRKSQRGGKLKFAYAIAEWEHDLQKLKKEYYKSNFTWPNY